MATETKAPIVQTGLKYKKATTQTFVYEVSDDRRATAHVSTIYVNKKAFLGEAAPQEIELTITAK